MFHWKYATKSLKRGGQRMVIALLCIAFGVMSLTSMQSLASTFKSLILINPRLSVGGDAQVTHSETNFLSEQDLAEIEALHQSGEIKDYVPVSFNYNQLLRIEGSSHAFFVNHAVGVDPTQYPLIGKFGLQDDRTLAQTLQGEGDAAITRDLATQLDIQVGDHLIMGGENSSVPIALTVQGIVDSTPDYQGQTVFFNLATAQALWGRESAITDVLVEWGTPSGEATLTKNGWSIYTPALQEKSNKKAADIFNFMLNGAGILGLLVGAIGVANTMQVLLAHRRKEIAVLKTFGYRPRDLLKLFGLETLLLGIIGSVIGVVAAIGVAHGLINVLARSSTMLIDEQFEPAAAVGGLLIGIVTTALFSVYAVWQASHVRPAMLFRELPAIRSRRRRLQGIGFYLLLAIPFSIVTSLILGSVWQGIAILLLAGAGFVALGLMLGVIIWLTLRLMPTIQQLRMAKNNIRRRWVSTLFALIALFLGVFALGFSLTIILAARHEFEAYNLPVNGYNFAIYTEMGDEAALREMVSNGQVRYEAEATNLQDGNGNPVIFYDSNNLQGRAALWDVDLVQGVWDTNGVYLPENEADLMGSTLTITLADHTEHILPVVGIYRARSLSTVLIPTTDGVLMHRDVLSSLMGTTPPRLMMAAQLPTNTLTEQSDRVGKAFPQAILINSADLNTSFTSTIKNLMIFAVAMAGLALLAGVMLMANAVGLAIVDRQREIGVLKAVGYTRRNVLFNVMLEYGLLGIIASITGVIAVQVFILLLQKASITGEILFMSPATALGVVFVGTGLTLATAGLVAWQPTQVRPVTILARE